MTEKGTPELPFTEGSVWSLQLIQVKPGATRKYLDVLRQTWKPVMDEAQRTGLITRYRILMGPPASPDDWSVLLAVEVPDMASLDGFGQKLAVIEAELSDGEHRTGGEQGTGSGGLRDVLGAKLVREVTLA
ncbi:hypothetical protein [Streptomyces sp. NBC_00358]|uniref:hypothetical protein n=1 Tax=Streptomyces sp. NBC_00358 TaxID=2975725 RepID=UPI002E274619